MSDTAEAGEPYSFLSVKAVLIWLAFLPFLAILYVTIAPSPDQSQFDWMAFIATQGKPFYVGSFDMNWPGAMWLHEAGVRMFGVHAWTWRLTDFILLSIFTMAGAVFLGRAGWSLSPTLFLFLYPPLYITAGGWMAGQRDIVATGFLIIACALAMPGRRNEWVAVFFAGMCVAVAVLIRPTFLSFFFGLIVLEALPLFAPESRRLARLQRALGFVSGFACGIGGAVLAGLVMGNFDDWYQQSIQFSLSIYVGEPPQAWRMTLETLFIRSWHWITALGLLGLLLWAWRDRGLSLALALVLGLAATSAVSFAVQNKGFGYHLGGVLPVLVLLNVVAFDSLISWRQRSVTAAGRFASTFGLVTAALLALAGTASKLLSLEQNARLALAGDFGPADGFGLTEAERRQIIEAIRSRSKPDETVFIYGNNFELGYRSERLPSHRFLNVVIDQADERFVHYDEWMAEIADGFESRPPAFVILAKKYIGGPVESPRAAHPHQQMLAQLIAMLNNYVLIFDNGEVLVYERTTTDRR